MSIILIYDVTGLDVLAKEKRGGGMVDGGFKAPRDRVASVMASIEEVENSESSGIEDIGSIASNNTRKHASRKYREIAVNETPVIGIF